MHAWVLFHTYTHPSHTHSCTCVDTTPTLTYTYTGVWMTVLWGEWAVVKGCL